MKNTMALFLCLFGIVAGTSAQTKELQVYFNDRPPLYIVKGETGFLTEIVKLILKEAKISYKFLNVPSNRVLSTIQEGKEYGVGIGWFKNADRESWAIFSKEIYKDKPQVIVANKEKAAKLGLNPTMETAFKSGLTIGRKEGYSFGTVMDELLKTINPKISVTTVEIPQLLKMVNIGRMDYTILGVEEITFLMQNDNELKNLVIIPFSNAPEGNSRFLMFSKAVDSIAVNQINAAIERVIESKEYRLLTTF